MKRTNFRGTQACICGHQTKDRKSFATNFEIRVGAVILLLGLPVVSVIMKSLDAAIVALILLMPCWIVLLLIRILRGHSIKCAGRWAVNVILGAIGGFGFLNF